MLLGMGFVLSIFLVIGSFSIFPWTIISLEYVWYDKIDFKKEIKELKLFWIFFISLYLVVNIIFVITYLINSEELKNYSECSEICEQDTKKTCKNKRELITCKEFLFLDKKEIEKAYFNTIPECNRNEWKSKMCKNYLTEGETIYRQD